jgi:hypothetical protein
MQPGLENPDEAAILYQEAALVFGDDKRLDHNRSSCSLAGAHPRRGAGG